MIHDAEVLAAEAFGAAQPFCGWEGTTSAIQSMILSVAKRGDKITLPQNVHRSVMGAMVLCGAVPVYVNPECDNRLGIPLGMKVEEVERAIVENPSAKAVLVNNPTYYGICSDLRSIVKLAHDHGAVPGRRSTRHPLLFWRESARLRNGGGADITAVSMHKSGGSLTQSSLLLAGACDAGRPHAGKLLI